MEGFLALFVGWGRVLWTGVVYWMQINISNLSIISKVMGKKCIQENPERERIPFGIGEIQNSDLFFLFSRPFSLLSSISPSFPRKSRHAATLSRVFSEYELMQEMKNE